MNSVHVRRQDGARSVSSIVTTAWRRGDISLADARCAGMIIRGRREWVRAFPSWFERYLSDVAREFHTAAGFPMRKGAAGQLAAHTLRPTHL